MPKIDWAEIEGLVVTGYRLQAPKTLVNLLDAERTRNRRTMGRLGAGIVVLVSRIDWGGAG